MGELPTFIHPGSGSTAAFMLVIGGVWAWFVLGARRAAEATGADSRAWTLRMGAGVALWAAITGLAQVSGFTRTGVAPLMGFFAASQLVAVVLAFSPVGWRFATGLPLAWLVGFHAFRFPRELVLHAWIDGGTLPIQMTWTGHNFDILTGLLAIGVGVWAWRGEPPRAVLWLLELVGLALLVVVATIAVTSSPLPLRQYLNDPPVVLAFYFPFGWIVPFAVAAALFGHLVLLRRPLADGGDLAAG